MSAAFALSTSDSNLLSCELARLEGQVGLGLPAQAPGASVASGVGSYAQDDVLIHRFGAAELPTQLASLVPVHRSELLLFHSALVPPGAAMESTTQPFRFRSWLFAMTGAVTGFHAFRAELIASLPDFLQRQITAVSDAEAAFGVFLAALREVGRTDDRRLPAPVAAELLGKTARRMRELSVRSGAARVSAMGFLATNGRVLAAARSGDAPLAYTLLEGSDRCEGHHLPSESTAAQQQLFAHRRRRTVAIASVVKAASGWIPLEDGQTLAVDSRQQLTLGRI